MRRVLSILVVGLVTALLFNNTAQAAPPALEITEGVVAASRPATFSPATTGPVSFSNTGTCPRWAGTINATNLATQPINSNISDSQLDAGDIVTFAITLQNTSIDGNAFDVTLNHVIPDGFELPGTGAEGANLCVTRGDNTAANFTSTGNGFFGTTDSDTIEITDSGTGSIAPTHPTNGLDIIVITFDLIVTADHVPNSSRTSTANLLFYSDAEGGDIIEGLSENSVVKMGTFGRTKTLVATNRTFTSGNLVVIGEEVTYELTIQVPEGVANTVTIVDTMTPGLAFISCDSIVNNSPSSLSTSIAGGIASACNDPINPTITSDGRIATFDLGTLTNTDRDNSEAETITIVYRGIVTNHTAATLGATLNNSAVVRWEDNNSATSGSAPVMIRESELITSIDVTPQHNLKSEDVITVTLNLSHEGLSAVPAFGVTMQNVVPAGLTPVPSSLQCDGGSLTPDSCVFSGNVLTINWTTFDVSEMSIITFDALVGNNLEGQSLNLDTSTTWSSLPGDVTAPQSAYSAISTERTGNTSNAGGAANTYATTNVAVLSVAALPGSGVPQNGSSADDPDGNGLADTGSNPTIIALLALILLTASVLILAKLPSQQTK